MLLKHFLLGALFALSSVAALPNPEADLHDVEARDGNDNQGHHHFHCPKDAKPTRDKRYPCDCNNPKERYDKGSNKCVCRDGLKREDHKCVCKDKRKEFKGGRCRCKDGMWQDGGGNCKCWHGHWDENKQKCKGDHHN